jgi:sugar lactone lactonase YvrE
MLRQYVTIIFFLAASSGLLAQPVINVEPSNAVVLPGRNATFNVGVTADCPMVYQWQFNGTDLPNNIITTLAGAGNYIYGDDGGGKLAGLSDPHGLVVDSNGNVFIADAGHDLIRVLGTNGIIKRVAGIGYYSGYLLGSGAALGVSINGPTDVILDPSGNLYFADQLNHRVCMINTNGILGTIAGKNQTSASSGFSGDGGQALGAGLNLPTGLTLDSSGNLYIADRGNNRIRKIDTNGIITTVAGKGGFGYSGDGDYATNAVLNAPGGVTIDSVGNMFIADTANHIIRFVDTNGIITTIAGTPNAGSFGGDGGAATNALLQYPESVFLDGMGNLLICDTYNARIRRVDTNGIITTLFFASRPTKIAGDSVGNLFVAESFGNTIRKRDTNGVLTVIAGSGSATYTGDTGPAPNAFLAGPSGVAPDASGNVLVADQNFNRIRRISSAGIIRTFAGTGTAGFSGDGAAATSAKISNPYGIVMDAAQNVFFSDSGNQRVRKIDTHGIITTVAGNGTAAFAGDFDFATNASLNSPSGVAVDASGNLFIADYNNNRIRKVNTNGIITTVAGKISGYAGDGGYATNAGISRPRGVAVDAVGNIFIADTQDNRIRKVDTNGIITTLAGTNTSGYSGDGGLAVTNRLSIPTGVAVDANGSIWIADQGNNRIRKIDTNGIITTMAGNGVSSFAGDGNSATIAALCGPSGIALDAAGNLIIADFGNFRVRKVIYSNRPVFTLLGVSSNNIGDYQVIASGACGSVTSSVAGLFFPPQIQIGGSNYGIQSNGFGFAVTGSSNQVVLIEASTELDNLIWEPVQTNTLGTDPFYFIDPGWTNFTRRYYRVRAP